jgi:hypothetical protein
LIKKQKDYLTNIYVSGLQFSEEDPLLLIVPDYNDPNAILYINNGNYGLAAGQPGFLPWPGIINAFQN